MTRTAILTLVAALAASGCQKGEPKTSTADPKTATAASTPPEAPPTTAQGVLERMVRAYKAATTYKDDGLIRISAETSKRKIDQKIDFSVTLERPNKLRVACYQGLLACDGKQWHAAVQGIANQVVTREAPAKITLKQVMADRVLAEAMTPEFTAPAPQLLLLLADDPLKSLLEGSQETALEQPGKLGEHDCYRVRIKWHDESAVYWIDQKTFVLRQIVLPTMMLSQELERDGGEVKSISVLAEFPGAELGGAADPKVFQFEAPPEQEQVRYFLPPDPAQLLGKKVPQCKFVDMQGKPLTLDSLAGKIIVLDFWASWCEPCKMSLPELEKVRQKYKDNDKVAFLAVSVDQPDVANKVLEESLQKLNVAIPAARDPDQCAGKLLKIMPIPVTMIVGPSGVVQDREMGFNPNVATALTEKIEKLLAGKDLYTEPAGKYETYRKMLEDAAEGRLPDEPKPGEEGVTETKLPLPQPKVAARTQPKTFKLTPLWKASDVKMPGNILVVPRPNAEPRIFVIDGLKSVAEVGPDGKVLATHKPELEQEELFCSLRTGVSGDGKRYFATFATGHQRFHLFDENWKLLINFPDNALANRHSGLADVELGDLDGNGVLKAYVGYWGVVGVQAVSLDGRRLWANRTLANVSHMLPGVADAQGRRELLCANENGALATVDAKGDLGKTIPVTGHFIETFAAADLAGDGQLLWCAISPSPDSRITALGIDLAGKVLWQYPLPPGRLQQPVEAIVPGKITTSGPGQWLFAGCDGSIHILAADGKPLDQFNYGAFLSGLATVQLDGKPVLLVSSESGLEAWRVE